MNVDKLKKSHENAIRRATIKSAVRVAKEIWDNFRFIKHCQPFITGAHTGMGSWSFNGHGIGTSTEDECKGDEVKIEDTHIDDIVREGNPDWYDFPVNVALDETVKLLDLLTDENALNCSTWQDGFNKYGIIFRHSETSNQNNPFATPNKQYQMDNGYYRGLVKAKVPIVWIDESEKHNRKTA